MWPRCARGAGAATNHRSRSVDPAVSTPTKLPWIAAGVLLVAAAAAGVYAANLRIQLQDVELRLVDAVTKLQDSQDRLVGAANQLDAFRSNLGLGFGTAGTRELTLAGRAAAAKASGRAFVGPTGLLLSVTGLPPLGANRGYQVWLRGSGAVERQHAMQADAQGNATAAFEPADRRAVARAGNENHRGAGGRLAQTDRRRARRGALSKPGPSVCGGYFLRMSTQPQ